MQSNPAETLQTAAASSRGFWSGYWKSLKPLEVEEPIDVWFHRPIAYVLARALLPTRVSPNAVTFASIVLGVIAGACLLTSFHGHFQAAGAALLLSTIFDCADGQLARMRGTSSRFGRMLDGVADLIVASVAVGGGAWVILQSYREPWWLCALVLTAATVTAVTGSFHTSMYDHYKNVFLKLTTATFIEGESYGAALARYRERPESEFGIAARLAWPIYLYYVKSQEEYVRRFDPYTSADLGELPQYDGRYADIYRRHAGPVMRVWRTWFGFGSLMFGLSVSMALNILDWYMLARLVAQNAVFYGYLRPAQREASRRAFDEIRAI